MIEASIVVDEALEIAEADWQASAVLGVSEEKLKGMSLADFLPSFALELAAEGQGRSMHVVVRNAASPVEALVAFTRTPRSDRTTGAGSNVNRVEAGAAAAAASSFYRVTITSMLPLQSEAELAQPAPSPDAAGADAGADTGASTAVSPSEFGAAYSVPAAIPEESARDVDSDREHEPERKAWATAKRAFSMAKSASVNKASAWLEANDREQPPRPAARGGDDEGKPRPHGQLSLAGPGRKKSVQLDKAFVAPAKTKAKDTGSLASASSARAASEDEEGGASAAAGFKSSGPRSGQRHGSIQGRLGSRGRHSFDDGVLGDHEDDKRSDGGTAKAAKFVRKLDRLKRRVAANAGENASIQRMQLTIRVVVVVLVAMAR
eukprot:tig00001409_g8629.t1